MIRVLLLLALFVARDAVVAQESAPPALQQLRFRQTIRVVTRTGETFEAKFVRTQFPPHGMLLEGRVDPFPFDAVDSLWTRRDAVGLGGAVGAVSFGLPAGVVGVAKCGGEGYTCQHHVANALAGTAFGAIVGAAVGAGAVHWDLVHPVAPAVSGGNADVDTDVAAARMAIWPGSRVRVASSGAPRISGEILRLRNDDLVLWRNGEEQRIALTPLDTVWSRRSSSRGARIGMLAGLATSTTWVLLESRKCAAEQTCSKPAFAYLAAGVGGGALVGSLAGRLIPQWRRVRP